MDVDWNFKKLSYLLQVLMLYLQKNHREIIIMISALNLCDIFCVWKKAVGNDREIDLKSSILAIEPF